MSRLRVFFSAVPIVAFFSVGMALASDLTLNEKINKAFNDGQLTGLHSVLIIHNDDIIAESYFSGEDERWGLPLGMKDHGPTTLHDLRSVTKPVVGLLYGIALAEGKVPDVDEAILAYFPEYAELADDPVRQRILIRHVLSMQMGIEWNEDLPYTDPENSEIAMENADDRYRYVLERPMINEPGDAWVYNGGAVALIAKLISEGVGQPIDKYAEQKLFTPLGIENFDWVSGGDDVPSAASGLRLNIHDLAKIGMLINNNGVFNGQQIVPVEWLEQSSTPYANLDFGLRYGYFWWLAAQGEPPSWVAGFGNGGQRLTVQPEHNLVIAVFAGNYNQADAWKLPVKLIEEFLVPAFTEK